MDSKLEVILSFGSIILKSINENDIESLRIWKNKNRQYFFYKKLLTTQEQKLWYLSYLDRKNDYIFMVLYNDVKIGCMGFREINGFVDIYNVILGINEFGKKGLMSKALNILCNYILDNLPKRL